MKNIFGQPPFNSALGLETWLSTRCHSKPQSPFKLGKEQWESIKTLDDPEVGTYQLGHGTDNIFASLTPVTASQSTSGQSSPSPDSPNSDYLNHTRGRGDSCSSAASGTSHGVPIEAPTAPRNFVHSSVTSNPSSKPAAAAVKDPFFGFQVGRKSGNPENRMLAVDTPRLPKSSELPTYGAIGAEVTKPTAPPATPKQEFNQALQAAVQDFAMKHDSAPRVNRDSKPKSQLPMRRSGNRDEFDGAVQTLPLPGEATIAAMNEKLPPTHVTSEPKECEVIMELLHKRLCKAAFDWVARYQFPIPRLDDRPVVTSPEDRSWNEWAYLLKRLATKRRIPARLLKDGHIKAFVPTMENSTMVPPPPNGAYHAMDDKYLLQVISAGIQVVRLIQDGGATQFLTMLYDSVAQRFCGAACLMQLNEKSFSKNEDDSC